MAKRGRALDGLLLQPVRAPLSTRPMTSIVSKTPEGSSRPGTGRRYASSDDKAGGNRPAHHAHHPPERWAEKTTCSHGLDWRAGGPFRDRACHQDGASSTCRSRYHRQRRRRGIVGASTLPGIWRSAHGRRGAGAARRLVESSDDVIISKTLDERHHVVEPHGRSRLRVDRGGSDLASHHADHSGGRDVRRGLRARPHPERPAVDHFETVRVTKYGRVSSLYHGLSAQGSHRPGSWAPPRVAPGHQRAPAHRRGARGPARKRRGGPPSMPRR